MSREIITIQIGQSGVQLGSAIWELYCMEHGISSSGALNQSLSTNNRLETLFYETRDGRFTPRSIFMDLEPSVVDEIRSGSYRNLFNPSYLLSGMEDAAGNYARGFFNLGKLHIDKLVAMIRKLVASCDNLSVFEILNSYSGGTGAGFTALLLERLNEEYNKKSRFSTGIFPSRTFSECTVGPYNALLYTHTTFDNLDCGILVDNESVYRRLLENLCAQKPSFSVVNRLLAQMISSVFVSSRYAGSGSQNMSVEELMTNSVPYPRIHFPVLAYAPLINRSQMSHEPALGSTNSLELTRQVFSEDSHFLTCPFSSARYISCCLLYRGHISPSQVYSAIASVKAAYNVRFVDWCPTGFKIGINAQPAMSSPNHVLASSHTSLCMLSGNIGIKFAWQNLRLKYAHLVSKRSFMHWFVGEGLEEQDFTEAHDDIQALERDYEELATTTNTATATADVNEPNPENEQNTSHSPPPQQHTLQLPIERNRTRPYPQPSAKANQNNSSCLNFNNQQQQFQTSYCKKLYEEVVQKIQEEDGLRAGEPRASECTRMHRKLHKIHDQMMGFDPTNNSVDSKSLPSSLVNFQQYPIESNLYDIQDMIRHKYHVANRNLSISHIESVSCDPVYNPSYISCHDDNLDEFKTRNDDDDSSRVTSNTQSSFLL